jgi:hypothetical protein
MRKVIIGLAIFFAAVAAVAELSSSHQSPLPAAQAPEVSPATSTALSPSLPSSCSPATLSTDATAAAADAAALLPVIPHPPLGSRLSLPPGVAPGIMGSLPGETPDPDDFKALYGYLGSYYNTANLDGQVAVLPKTLVTWSTSSWRVTGMLRNQTRCTIHINQLSARLLGTSGHLVAAVTTTVPVADLRPGEPGPFIIDAPIAGSYVKAVEWHVDYQLAEGVRPRLFTFETYEDGKVLGGARYDLVGAIRNAATTTARDVRVVVAWLDYQDKGRVRFVTSTKLRYVADPSKNLDSITLNGGEDEDFLFITSDPALVSLLSESRPVLWGIAQ